MSNIHECPAGRTTEKPATERSKSKQRRPWGLEWRSSIWFITLVVGIAITTDLLIYSMIVPIIPFRLQSLGYEGVSGLVGWLLFAYASLLITPPIAFLSEMYKNRKVPLLLGQAALIGSQVLLMEAPAFWVMVLARIAQGISACVIWVVGLALICDTVPEKIVGSEYTSSFRPACAKRPRRSEQLGLAMMGMSLGFLIGPPVSGALDERFGFRGPFIFGIIVTGIELIGRLLIIERKEAIRHDASFTTLVGRRNNSSPTLAYGTTAQDEKRDQPVEASAREARGEGAETTEATGRAPSRGGTETETQEQGGEQDPVQLSIPRLLFKLVRSPRALSAIYLTLSFGIMLTSLEPVLPLYLQETFGLDVSKIGLVYIVAVVPSFVSSPLSGWYADRGGTTTSTIVCLLGSLPFWFLIFIRVNLAYFLVMFGFLNLFATGTISPVTAEFASVTRSLEGVGYGHVYGAFNVAYGIGSALGPVIGGQLYDHVSSKQGWMALNLFNAGLAVVNLIVTVCYFGERTIVQRVTSRIAGRAEASEASADSSAV
ncbi:MFS general substrate transporter [Pilatotrama ljubarskyi]|nr:MFS general substrate transporter [Pilatotrama ljubarskyi]